MGGSVRGPGYRFRRLGPGSDVSPATSHTISLSLIILILKTGIIFVLITFQI